jgi:hypothetical protein
MIRTILTASISMMLIAPVAAQEITLMLGGTGMCHRDIDCSAVILTEFDTGRLMINVVHESGAVGFSGVEDSSNPEDGAITIAVDTIRFGKGDGSGDVHEVTGSCVADFKGNYTIWAYLVCSVFNRANDNFVIFFEGDGSPIKRQM